LCRLKDVDSCMEILRGNNNCRTLLLNLIALPNRYRMFPLDELSLCGSVSLSRNMVSMCHLDYCNYLVFQP